MSLAVPGDGHWDRQFAMPGTHSRNLMLRCNGNTLYAGGYSLGPGGMVDTNTLINVFDGTNWTSLGKASGSLGYVYDIAFVGSNTYVCGIFTHVDGVPTGTLAKWDGVNWTNTGTISGTVITLATDGTNLYAGGIFTNVGGITVTNVARWNGANWSSMGGGLGIATNIASYYPYGLFWKSGQLYATGSFTNSGSTPIKSLARWDGNSWTELGGGVNGTSGPLGFIGSDIYVGGTFTSAGGTPAQNIAKWNGSSWSALGSGLVGGGAAGICEFNGEVYVSGSFTNAGGTTASRIAKWDGFSWSSIGGLNDVGRMMVSNAGALYVCGDFNLANGNVIGNHIIRWDGSTWSGVSTKPCKGTYLFVQSLETSSDSLYMGGVFTAVGNTPASRIARYDGTNWYPMGDGISGVYGGATLTVRSISARNSDVFAGGGFTYAGPQTANNIAQWDGANWLTLGYGVDFTVFAVAATDSEVYVGGSFTNAYDFPWWPVYANRIARYDRASGTWSALGTGMSGTVNDIKVHNGLVYAGGSFTNAGGVSANRIAVWNGSTWSALGSGLNNTVNAIYPDGTDIYAAGSFTNAGGVLARGIAKWNGSSWSALGQGLFNSSTATGRAIVKSGGYLYVSGTFTNAGGTAFSKGIARWNGSSWEGMGQGLGVNSASVSPSGLKAWGNDIYVGGIFEDAGGSDAGYIARWNDQIDFTPPSTMRLTNPQMLPGNVFSFRATATENAAYVVEYTTNFSQWLPLATNSLSAVTITNNVPGINFRTYRMREIP